MTDLKPIGVIRTPYETAGNIPIQGALFPDTKGTVEVYGEYAEGLADVNGFSHLILLYLFDRSDGYKLKARPFLDDVERGLFSIRAPRRPNPIGFTVVELDSVEGNVLHVRGVDMLNGTPLLDIKPYIPSIDSHPDARTGWVAGKMRGKRKSDRRFLK